MPGIPDELMYSLDCGVAGGDLTSDVHAYLTLFDRDLVGWYNSLNNRDFFPRFRAESRQRYANWRSSAALDDRAALTWIGFNEVPSLIKDSARHVLSNAIKECGPTLPEVVDLLSDDAFIAAHASPFLPSFREIVMRARDDIRMTGASDFNHCRTLLPDLYRRIMVRRNEQAEDGCVYKLTAAGGNVEPRRVRKARRRPLVKASELLSRIAGRETASAFIGGDDVTVSGKRFNFRVRKGVLGSNGHGAMNLTVTDKEHIELVDLCFYFEDMPAPDQVAALILHVQAGNEDEILQTANAIRTYEGGRTNEAWLALREQKKRKNELPASELRADGVRGGMSNHIDRVLYDGMRGASDFYNEHHDQLVPMLEQTVIQMAIGSRSGEFLQTFVPDALSLFEVATPSPLAIGRAIAEEPLMVSLARM